MLQVKEITERSEAVKVDVYRNLTSNTLQAESYSATSQRFRDEFSDLWKTSNRFLTHSDDLTVMARRAEHISKLDEAIQLEVQPCQLFRGRYKVNFYIVV